MPAIQRESLMTLEAYAKARKEYRTRIIGHKKARTVHLGDHITLMFEDEFTMRYQIQEMLLSEKAFEEEAILDELAVYNPLVPDGSNWKATMMIEYPDPDERTIALAKLRGIEERVWVQVADQAKVFAIADEDMERENAEKTSAVHFLRFELDATSIAAAKAGSPIRMGIDLAAYPAASMTLADNARAALVVDLA